MSNAKANGRLRMRFADMLEKNLPHLLEGDEVFQGSRVFRITGGHIQIRLPANPPRYVEVTIAEPHKCR